MPPILSGVIPEYITRDLYVLLSSGSPPLFLQLLALNFAVFIIYCLWRAKAKGWRMLEGNGRLHFWLMLTNAGIVINSGSSLL